MKFFLIFPFGLFLLFAVNLGAQPLLEAQSDQNVRISCECIDSEEESIDTVHFTSGAYFLLDNDQIQRIVKVLYHNKLENNWYIYDSENNKIIKNKIIVNSGIIHII